MRTRTKTRSLLVSAVMAAVIAGCGADGTEGERAGEGEPVVEDAGAVHVHGLDIAPDDGALLIATHTGLFRSSPGERTSDRIGDRYHDLMGFTVAASERFVASGHPDGREQLPPFLGLIESRDRGRTWKPVSLLGEVDFHVLETSGDRIYAFGSEYESGAATMQTSSDGGRSWKEIPPPEPLFALAVDPDDSDRAIAAGERALYRTSDAGESWRPIGGPVGLLAWPAPNELYSVTPGGAVALSADGGDTFEQTGALEGDPAAFHAVRGGDLYVALHDGVIVRSRDGGRSWSVRVEP